MRKKRVLRYSKLPKVVEGDWVVECEGGLEGLQKGLERTCTRVLLVKGNG